MIEQGIYFALGSIVTALASLAFVPILWRRALRLTRRRLQLQVPLSMQEILAERDQLRAEFAVERVRLEQSMERVRATKSRDMTEIGHLTVVLAKRADEIAALSRVEHAQEGEIGRLRRDLAASEADGGALRNELDDVFARNERHRELAKAATVAQRGLIAQRDGLAAALATAEARGRDLEAGLAEMERAALDRDTRVEDALRARLETAMRHAARHEASGLSTRRELDEAKAHIRVLEQNAVAMRGALEEVLERERSLNLQRSMGADRGRGQDDPAGRIDLLKAENAALQEALMATGQTGALSAPASTASDDESLRASIHALGIAVAAMMRDARGGPESLGRTGSANVAPQVVEPQ